MLGIQLCYDEHKELSSFASPKLIAASRTHSRQRKYCAISLLYDVISCDRVKQPHSKRCIDAKLISVDRYLRYIILILMKMRFIECEKESYVKALLEEHQNHTCATRVEQRHTMRVTK